MLDLDDLHRRFLIIVLFHVFVFLFVNNYNVCNVNALVPNAAGGGLTCRNEKSAAPSILLARPTTASNTLWIGICAIMRSSNECLVLLLKLLFEVVVRLRDLSNKKTRLLRIAGAKVRTFSDIASENEYKNLKRG